MKSSNNSDKLVTEITALAKSAAPGHREMMRTYKDIEYTLKRSNRKTASIYIERDGQVSVLVPKELDQQADRRTARKQTEVDLPQSGRVA